MIAKVKRYKDFFGLPVLLMVITLIALLCFSFIKDAKESNRVHKMICADDRACAKETQKKCRGFFNSD